MAKKNQTTEKKVATKAEVEVATASSVRKVIEAIALYQIDTTINENVVNDTLTEKQKECTSTLDKAMKPLPLMELNRLVLAEVIKKYMEQAGVDTIADLKGKQIENVPYMSVSKNPLREMLQARYDIGLDKPKCLVIHTEGKAKGIDVEKCLERGNNFKGQREVILARGQRFLVKDVIMADGWGEAYPVIHLYAI